LSGGCGRGKASGIPVVATGGEGRKYEIAEEYLAEVADPRRLAQAGRHLVPARAVGCLRQVCDQQIYTACGSRDIGAGHIVERPDTWGRTCAANSSTWASGASPTGENNTESKPKSSM
jgi:hypothetical protein